MMDSCVERLPPEARLHWWGGGITLHVGINSWDGNVWLEGVAKDGQQMEEWRWVQQMLNRLMTAH